ncbi:neural Wiskott-Aldrich syndrome protein-like [Triticum urartu]|uniref:neural Wiskott-Aldrich syndrome protein-like n=1 Tax=Triticum urartu TaxID=4572 RepID=UPI002042F3F8|nr:neural Wiskott-Aldrich syndrome protein-like [Triticum urartu]
MRRPARGRAMGAALVLAVLAVAAATAGAVDGDVKCAECGTGTVPVLPPPPPYYYYSPPPPASYSGVSNCPPPPGGYIQIGGSGPGKGRMYPQDPGFMPSSAPPRHGSSAVHITVCSFAALAVLRAFW